MTTTAQRALWGRVGAAIARARHDPRDLTRNARATFLSKFEQQVRAQWPDLSEAEVERRAGELRRAHFLRLAARSAEVRAKKAAGPDKPTAEESNRAETTTDHRPAA